ncbi:MAG TPA: metallophosphoesterase [Symbiobacteriaceae bacterium]|jgi:predicted MPP superfamily phosphohydrolase|nr:metallophosphoesterase [Symbiobacteriaceae bacterium]
MLTRRQMLIAAGTVLLSASGCSKLKLPVTPAEVPAAEQGPRPYRVALLSDPHTEAKTSLTFGATGGKLSQAVADLNPLIIDQWLCCGDVANHGLPEEWEAYKSVLAKVSKPDQWLVTTGNHEFYNEASDQEVLQGFRKAFSLQRPYSNKVAGGVHFVMLADEQYKTAPGAREWAWVTPEQLRWFEQVLQEHRDKFTVVCLHQPLQETVLWSHGGNDFAGCGQVKQLRAILQKNPQVRLWLSGHTHLALQWEGQVVRQGGVTFACLGSTYYQFVASDAPEDQGGWPAAGGYKKDLSASQSRVMEVWPDRVVVRARDHVKQVWLDKLQFEIARG